MPNEMCYLFSNAYKQEYESSPNHENDVVLISQNWYLNERIILFWQDQHLKTLMWSFDDAEHCMREKNDITLLSPSLKCDQWNIYIGCVWVKLVLKDWPTTKTSSEGKDKLQCNLFFTSIALIMALISCPSTLVVM